MSIKIAICDDESYICARLEYILLDILKELGIQNEIETFESGEALCLEMARQCFDLVFLDIELPNINGIEIGRYIRDVLQNERLQIVYISGYPNYAMELFDFHPMNFLIKPFEKDKVRRVIQTYQTIAEQHHLFFEYKKRTEFYKVPMADILYFESRYRKMKIVTRDFEDEFYETMGQVYSAVEGQNFLWIHKSFLVNEKFVMQLRYEEVVMSNGVVLPISQSRRTIIRSQYMERRKRKR